MTATLTRRPCTGDPEALGVVHDWQRAGQSTSGVDHWRCRTCGVEDWD